MPGKPYREVITIHGTNVTLEQAASPIGNLGVIDGQDMFKKMDFFDPKLHPEIYNKADGAPLRMFDADGVKIDLSKRSREDMGFWHRNVDYNEAIFCVQGALRWETEMRTETLRADEMTLIPKGFSHRSMLCDESEEENILLELKIRDQLTYVGDGESAKE